MLVLRGGTVVDVDGHRNGDVVVEGGEVRRVGDGPDDPERELDATGRYVAPGLVDAHVHLTTDGKPDPASSRDEGVATRAMRAVVNLLDLLAAGVTATRDHGAADAFDDAFGHAVDAWVPVAMGTDAGTPFNYHADAGQELAYVVDHGMTPADALAAATVGGAQLLGLGDHGHVERGARADLVVLDADRLEDPTTWQTPVAVVRDGRVVA